MMETLSIIAYKQPVTRIEIEKIRGVKCDHAINKLIEYNLVQELGRLDAPGRPILLGTTEEFLRNFGVDSTEHLPTISPVKLEDFKAEARRKSRSGWTSDGRMSAGAMRSHSLCSECTDPVELQRHNTESEGGGRHAYNVCT